MKIVLLDGHTTNPGDLSWSALEALGELVLYDQTAPDQTAERLRGAEAVLTNKTEIAAPHMDQSPELKYIGIMATGTDIVDIAAAKERGITVTNIPMYASNSVAQLTFALILELCYRTGLHSVSVIEDLAWSAQAYNSYWLNPLVELDGKTLGIFGMGRIGERVARIGQAFGMHVTAYDVYRRDCAGIRWVTPDELFAGADVLSLHCPLTMETEGVVNQHTLAKMKSGAFLINTSRGALVAGQYLADALNGGRLAGAGLDVLETEPPDADNPLLRAKNVVITPHIGWATLEARSRLIQMTADNLRAFKNGAPVNRVNQ
ncbi:MAG: D-2-hydroxyacid dehydrogenase [Peptococcaceae bacterium]|jgi:glycerate dehydrogenase|nr:D-2-hydroxyacid dehydrogenase [Peptococcaceae bacterium]